MNKLTLITLLILLGINGCKNKTMTKNTENTFEYNVEQFADLKIIRYQVPGFDKLPLEKKKLLYFLSQAAIEGRDIIFDQNYKHNLKIRKTLEAILVNYKGDKSHQDYKAFEVYLKRVWFSNGIHHHYSMDKMKPGFSVDFFKNQVSAVQDSELPLGKLKSKDELINLLTPVIFDPTVDTKRVNLAAGQDLIQTSANNYYGEGISQDEVESYYASIADPKDKEPISYGLNSTLVKKDGSLQEVVWKIDGKYGAAISKIVYWLEKASEVTENSNQKNVIDLLVQYYKTGDLKTFDSYNIAWLNDLQSQIDFVNGFIETYGDPLGLKASWESVVNFKDNEASKRTVIISDNAQWFETNSPVNEIYKKKEVKGVTAKVITAAMLGGDCYPATPIGINLPNADWIRKEHGSKSVTIENITYAYDQSAKGNGFLQEFAFSDAEIERAEKYGFLTGNLHTDLHECLGHGSGQLLPGVKGDELKAYGATVEEARADLFGLYYTADPKLIELGLLPDGEAYKAEYDAYIRNGLMTQLTRIELGDNIEESHMRNRQLIAQWVYEKGETDKVIEKKTKNGKSFFVINDYQKLRLLFGELLAKVQEIKSTGNFEEAALLVEKYAVKVDFELHKEVKERYAKLNLAPYGGFINPVYVVKEKEGEIVDVTLDYTQGYSDQMLDYSTNHGWLSN